MPLSKELGAQLTVTGRLSTVSGALLAGALVRRYEGSTAK